MPRQPRIDLPGIAQHVVQRGNDRRPCFFQTIDHVRYLDELREATIRADCTIHAYVLMTNHVHLLVTPTDTGQVGQMMQALGRRYVRYINDRYRRTGTLWEGRYNACPVQSDDHLLRCYRYIEPNPVRAGMVATPADYRWSSHAANALGRPDPLLTPHPVFIETSSERSGCLRSRDRLRSASQRDNALTCFPVIGRPCKQAAGRRSAPRTRLRPPEDRIVQWLSIRRRQRATRPAQATQRRHRMIPKNTICLWYDRDALAAATFYAEIFPNSSVDAVHNAPGDFPEGKQGDVLTVDFTVMGIPCMGLNGGPAFKHSEAFSFQVATDDQAETDRLWNAIVGNGGQESECGWCKDRWGLSWQITPRALTEAWTDPDRAAAKRAFDAMMTMRKIDIATIEAARRG